MTHFFKFIESPVGKLKLVASNQGLSAVLWENDNPKRVNFGKISSQENHPLLLKAEQQLQEYFAGKRQSFEIELDFRGTDFQQKVWQALLTIPFGETRSYGEIAKQISNHKASRPVGAANGRNPIAIIAPCHRVIGASGKLTGFAGGLAVKEFLLKFEQSNFLK